MRIAGNCFLNVPRSAFTQTLYSTENKVAEATLECYSRLSKALTRGMERHKLFKKDDEETRRTDGFNQSEDVIKKKNR